MAGTGIQVLHAEDPGQRLRPGAEQRVQLAMVKVILAMILSPGRSAVMPEANVTSGTVTQPIRAVRRRGNICTWLQVAPFVAAHAASLRAPPVAQHSRQRAAPSILGSVAAALAATHVPAHTGCQGRRHLGGSCCCRRSGSRQQPCRRAIGAPLRNRTAIQIRGESCAAPLVKQATGRQALLCGEGELVQPVGCRRLDHGDVVPVSYAHAVPCAPK
jgi:hypothetical protein